MSPAPHSRKSGDFPEPKTVEIFFVSRNGGSARFSQFSTNSAPAAGDKDPSAEPKASVLAALLLRYEESGHQKFQVESRSLYDAVRRPRNWLCDLLHISKSPDDQKCSVAVEYLLESTEAEPRDAPQACLEEKSTSEPLSGGNGWVILTDCWAQVKVRLYYNGALQPLTMFKPAAAYLLGRGEDPWNKVNIPTPPPPPVAGPQVDVTVNVSLNRPPSASKICFLRALAELMEGEIGNPTQQTSPRRS